MREKEVYMFCPNCRYEYENHVSICPECGAVLVPELPPEETPQYTDLVTVYTTSDAGMIGLVKSILEDAGIDYYVRGESTKALFAAGFMEVQVHPEDADEAEMLIEEMGKGGDVGPLDVEDNENG